MEKIIIQCRECQGTGLYKGMAERDNCATVCSTCKGTGKSEFYYNKFTGKKVKENIKRVFGNTCGYVHSDVDITTEQEGRVIKFSEGGCSYEEWLNGEIPKPVKELYCPYIWNNKGVGNEPIEDCKIYCKGFGSISSCENYHNKKECWIKFESNK